MLTYSELTKSQKRWAHAMIEFYPKLENGGSITLNECWVASTTLYAQRVAGSPKIGYPNWLFGVNKIRKGLYFFPAPGAEPAAFIEEAKAQTLAKRLDNKNAFVVECKEDEDFLAELLEAGIQIKVAPQTPTPL